jgi:tetraacyldisaccharide 4'-kinase
LLGDAIPLAGGEPIRLDALRGKTALAFAGIAEPELFFDGLRGHGLDLVATLTLPDHADYDDEALHKITDQFVSSGAEILLTTEKDGVKLNSVPVELLEKILLARLELAIDDPTPLAALLRNLLQK